MKLYIAQHGAALSKEEDSSRPLSERGRDDVRRLGRWLAHAGLGDIEFVHSGKLRARETAELIAAAVGGTAGEADGLGPNDDLAPWLTRLGDAPGDLALVGHQPFVGRLATRLLNGRESPSVVAFEPGTMLCLEHGDESWTLRWMVGPVLWG
ncbi:phosphohistidine phosphatase SixA [Ectothiorhodospiraceae bacterium WFHF3C12]|nr:phosphohistidine phosphatase SixA [Ectothiorhodospiraceae bacterium WFHF3C12]